MLGKAMNKAAKNVAAKHSAERVAAYDLQPLKYNGENDEDRR